MRKVTLLVIPLLIVMAARDQQAVSHLAEILFVGGVKLLNLVATILNNLLAAPSVRSGQEVGQLGVVRRGGRVIRLCCRTSHSATLNAGEAPRRRLFRFVWL